MALRNAVMAALLEGEASGYDLAKRFDTATADFWTSTPQQLYRELERMESEGLIQARVVEQERRPNKRMFSLTPAGREALHAFTARPARPTAIRDELLVKVQAVDSGDEAAVRTSIMERMERARAKLARYERIRDRLLDGRTEQAYLRETDHVGPFLTLMRGRFFEEENLRWGELCLEILDRRAAERDGSPAGPRG
ncbi:PadR family transcriptional regulator [Nocardiopsis composta]|uniref:DNA-binding PadR family transcriptional regulator n=1 Tax=Nocardiopsis composta TaxID=157465 RepID=A0A7W8QMF0_9ACTN|nr:PadR family transcriptional regulator [Nocardiopsis composta]MBB5432495.1 DNA-binding PadR family transcriptional regulator [Nocardiopsis composta]